MDHSVLKWSCASLLLLWLAACGGGGSGDSLAPPILPPAVQLELLAGDIGGSGNVDGIGSAARFKTPLGAVSDGAGNIYIADSDNFIIRKISASGEVTTLAGGAGIRGSTDGNGTAARFRNPVGLAIDASGVLFVADDSTIRRVTAAGDVTTYAGSSSVRGYADGNVAVATFDGLQGLAFDSAGNLYVVDQTNQLVRKISPTGVVSRLAGIPATPGWQDGDAATAMFNYPGGIAVDTSGKVYVADTGNNVIRVITETVGGHAVSTLVGDHTTAGFQNGAGTLALFSGPTSLAVDGAANVFVTDSNNHVLRKVTPSGDVTTFSGSAGVQGFDDGVATARFNYPAAVTMGDSGSLIVTQFGDHTVRLVTSSAEVSTIAGAPAITGSADANGAAARFDIPKSIALDVDGNSLVSDGGNQGIIRRISPAGDVTTVLAGLNVPEGVALDAAGNLYIADSYNHVIRKMDAFGAVTVIAGTLGAPGSVNANGTNASFNTPGGLAVDAANNIYVADTGNHTIRMIAPNGDVTTVAGSPGVQGGVDKTGAAALFRSPKDIVCDPDGILYVADYNNYAIRKIEPGGIVTTIAGTLRSSGFTDGQATTAALFSRVSGIDRDADGNLFVADTDNNAIRKITPAGDVSTIVGTKGKTGVKLGDMPSSLDAPRDVAVRADGELFIVTANGVVISNGL